MAEAEAGMARGGGGGSGEAEAWEAGGEKTLAGWRAYVVVSWARAGAGRAHEGRWGGTRTNGP